MKAGYYRIIKEIIKSFLLFIMMIEDRKRIILLKQSTLDKLLGQLGIYATWLSSIAYLQKQLRIFIFFMPHFFFCDYTFPYGNVLAYLFSPILCLSKVSNLRILLYLKQISSPC